MSWTVTTSQSSRLKSEWFVKKEMKGEDLEEKDLGALVALLGLESEQ